MPKISVIMPAYNAEKYIKEAMDSILNQTFGDFEFIAMNDCSRDSTEEIILSYQDDRIVYVKNEQNMGVAATLNKGLRLAKGEYIARMDSDDISMPNRFALQVACLDAHPEVAVLGGLVEVFDETGKTTPRPYRASPAQIKIDLLFASALAHPSVMMRRDVILEMGGYDREFEGLEDYELWCRVAAKHQIMVCSDEVLLRYRIHSAQVTQQSSPRKDAAQKRIRAWHLRQLGLPEEGLAAEGFYGYYARREKTLEQVLAENAFYEAVIDANKAAKLYDEKLLKKTFRQLLKSSTLGLEKPLRRQICKQSKLLHAWELGLSEAKMWLFSR